MNGEKMYTLFLVCIIGVITVVPIHFLSVEHQKLQEKYGKDKGTRIGETYSFISGWGFFLFWAGLWLSPQPRFIVPILGNVTVLVPIVNFTIPILHLIIFAPFFAAGAWLGIEGVKETTLKVAETHRTERIITSGVYSIIRHPQYVGGLLAHVGVSFLLSGCYSLVSTPLMIVLVYLISKKEEEELIKEFGNEYEYYKKRVPMLVPRLGK